MTNGINKKVIESACYFVIAIILFFIPSLMIPVLDDKADVYFETTIKQVGISYVTCRIINGSVSIIKDSNIQIEPAGVGMSIAVGQILDPIDDMTERFSTVIVTSIVSLGVQKLLYEVGVETAPRILSILMICFSIFVWIESAKLKNIPQIFIKIFMVVLFIRFCLPVSAIISSSIHKNFFSPRIEQSTKELEPYVGDFSDLEKYSFPEIDGFVNTLKSSSSFMKNKIHQFKNSFVKTVHNMDRIIDNLIELTLLYSCIFLIQVIFLPLFVFWLTASFIRSFSG